MVKMRVILNHPDINVNHLEAYLVIQIKKKSGITLEQIAVISKFWKSLYDKNSGVSELEPLEQWTLGPEMES